MLLLLVQIIVLLCIVMCLVLPPGQCHHSDCRRLPSVHSRFYGCVWMVQGATDLQFVGGPLVGSRLTVVWVPCSRRQ